MSNFVGTSWLGQLAKQGADYYLALRCSFWILVLPARLRFYSLPGLLQRLTPQRARLTHLDEADIHRTARIVRRVARLPVFRLSVFPRICLRQSLALYWILRELDPSAEIHFGVCKDDSDMRAHCWITVREEPVLERAPLAQFQRLYTYPSPTAESSWGIEGCLVGQMQD